MLRRKVCQYFMYDERNKLQGISVQMVPAHTNLQRIPSFFYIYFLRVKKKKDILSFGLSELHKTV